MFGSKELSIEHLRILPLQPTYSPTFSLVTFVICKKQLVAEHTYLVIALNIKDWRFDLLKSQPQETEDDWYLVYERLFSLKSFDEADLIFLDLLRDDKQTQPPQSLS